MHWIILHNANTYCQHSNDDDLYLTQKRKFLIAIMRRTNYQSKQGNVDNGLVQVHDENLCFWLGNHFPWDNNKYKGMKQKKLLWRITSLDFCKCIYTKKTFLMIAWLFHFRERKRLFLRFPQILHSNDQRVFMIKQIYCSIETEWYLQVQSLKKYSFE